MPILTGDLDNVVDVTTTNMALLWSLKAAWLLIPSTCIYACYLHKLPL